MKRIALGLGFATLVSAYSARAEIRYPYSMTGEGLISQFYAAANGGSQSDSQAAQLHERARGYISGVKDSHQGTKWCHLSKLKPDELDSMLISDLQQLSPESLKGLAAPLLVAALKKRFPCPPGRAK